MISYSVTHQGYARENNEDRYFSDISKNIYIICDGMGGHDRGEKAAEIAITEMAHCISEWDAKLSNADLYYCAYIANQKVLQAQKLEMSDMATTLVAVVIKDDSSFQWINFGDSRLYIFDIETKKLRQLSTDDANNYGFITKYIGNKNFYYDKSICKHTDDLWSKGDYLMICSDGLTTMVPDNKIEQIFNLEKKVERICERLMFFALDSGGMDNITLTIIQNNQRK